MAVRGSYIPFKNTDQVQIHHIIIPTAKILHTTFQLFLEVLPRPGVVGGVAYQESNLNCVKTESTKKYVLLVHGGAGGSGAARRRNQ